MDRRSFLRSLAFFPLAAWLGRNVFAADAKADAAVGKKLVKPTDPLPSALKYTDDAKKAPKELRKSNDMMCKTCIQYTKKTTLKGEEVGTCNLFNGGYVKSGGWCMSWSKKG